MDKLEKMLNDLIEEASGGMKKAMFADALLTFNVMLTLYIAKKMGVENAVRHCAGIAVVSSVEKFVREIGDDSRDEVEETADSVYHELMKIVDEILDKVSAIDDLPSMDSL